MNLGRKNMVILVILLGKQDEVRISNIARTAGWIKATHYSLIDGLVSWGK